MEIRLFDNFEELILPITTECDKLERCSALLIKLDDMQRYSIISREDSMDQLTNITYEVNNLIGDNISFEKEMTMLDRIKDIIAKIYNFIKNVLVKIRDAIKRFFSVIVSLTEKMLGQTKNIKEKINNIKIKHPDLYKKEIKLKDIKGIANEYIELVLLSPRFKNPINNLNECINRLSVRLATIAKMLEVLYPGLEYAKDLIKMQSLEKDEYSRIMNQMGYNVLNLIRKNKVDHTGWELIDDIATKYKDKTIQNSVVLPLSYNSGFLYFMYAKREPNTDRHEVYYNNYEININSLGKVEETSSYSLEKLDKSLQNIDRDNKLLQMALDNLDKAQKRTTDRLEVFLESANDKLNNRTITEPFPSFCRDIVAYMNNVVSPLVSKEYVNIVAYTGKVMGSSVKLLTSVYNMVTEELKNKT